MIGMKMFVCISIRRSGELLKPSIRFNFEVFNEKSECCWFLKKFPFQTELNSTNERLLIGEWCFDFINSFKLKKKAKVSWYLAIRTVVGKTNFVWQRVQCWVIKPAGAIFFRKFRDMSTPFSSELKLTKTATLTKI